MRYIISLLLASTALPALADAPRVVTDIPPVHSIAAQVMGDLGQPELLLDRGANAHSYQLRPSQAANLANAGLVIWIGPEMTPWMTRALDGLSPDVPRLGLLTAEGTFRRDYGDTSAHDHDDHDHDHDHAEAAKAEADAHAGHDHGHDHGDHSHDHAEEAKAEAHDHDHAEHAHGEDHDHGHDHDHDHDHDGHSHTGVDPHAWLDPANAKIWAGVIAAELSRLDPENADTYAANAAAAQARYEALDAELAAMLAPVADKPFVVYHDAYGYFVSHYGLTLAGAVALGDASSPGAARLRELSQTVTEGGALCLFPESQHDPALVTQMADGTSARVGAALDPEGSTIEPGPDAYGALMRALATNIVTCLNG